MVGLWSPDPPPEPENLEENYPDYVVVVGPSDEEHSEEGYEGYEPLSDLGDMSDEFNDDDDGDEESEVDDVKDNSEEEPGCSYRQLELSDLTVSYIKSAMANIILPASATPPWANRIPEEEWIQFLCARVKLLQVKNQRVNDSDSSESEG